MTLERCPRLTGDPLPICGLPGGRDVDDAYCYSHHISRAWERCDVYQRHRADLAEAKVAPMLATLEAVTPTTDEPGWWCPTCKDWIDGSHVTHNECHEACGTYLNAASDPDWITQARAAIAAARGEG